MYWKSMTRALFALATAAVLALPGCSTDVSEGDLPAQKPKDEALE